MFARLSKPTVQVSRMNLNESTGEVQTFNPSVSSCVWTIPNWLNVLEFDVGEFITSPECATDHPNIKWHLVLFPHGRVEQNENHVSLFVEFIRSDDCRIREITVTMKLGLLDSKGDIIVKQRLVESKYKLLSRHELQNRPLPKCNGRDNFASRQFVLDEGNDLMRGNTLRIFCQIISDDPLLTKPLLKRNTENTLRLEGFDDFEQLLDSEKFSDVVFVIDERQIFAHKAILVTRSVAFEVMFGDKNECEEKTIINIVDVKYDVMKELLRFVYVAKVHNIERMSYDLLMAAEKFCVWSLGELCEAILIKNLDVHNVLTSLIVADACNNAVSLKAQALELIIENAIQVTEKNEFDELPKHLICEITRGIAKIHRNV